MDSSGKIDYLLIAGAAVLWGSVGVFLRWIDLPGREHFVVFIRSIISLCFLTLVVYASGKREQFRPGKHPFLLVASGALLAFHWVIFMKALNNLSIGDAEFITYLAPVFVALLAPMLLGERLEGTTIVALALAVAGMFLIALTGQDGGTALNGPGILYALTAAVSYALLLVILKKLRRDTPTLTITLYQTGVNALLLLPFCAFRDFQVSTGGWVSLIVLGTVHTAFAGLVYVHAVKKVKAQHVGIIAYLEPLSSVVFGLIFLGEHPGWQDLAGGVLIIAAGAMVIRRAWAGGAGEPGETHS
ncbi:MAG: EamA family transporter [Actinobacteria bacterium]|nr:EamA family transporter [Actinomycetota bacterium]